MKIKEEVKERETEQTSDGTEGYHTIRVGVITEVGVNNDLTRSWALT